MTHSQRLDATFAALADPTRRAILARLTAGEASVMELSKPFAMSQPAISKHLLVLERAGLISRGGGLAHHQLARFSIVFNHQHPRHAARMYRNCHRRRFSRCNVLGFSGRQGDGEYAP